MRQSQANAYCKGVAYATVFRRGAWSWRKGLCLSLDGLHLIIAVQAVDKRSRGAKQCLYYLRKIMHKLILPDRDNNLGDVWLHGPAKPHDGFEKAVLRMAKEGSLSRRASIYSLQSIDAESPLSSRFEFITYITSLVCAFPIVMNKVPQCHKSPLKQSLMYAASPARAEYYLNESRFRRCLTDKQLKLMGAGTTRNEAEHHKMNSAFRTTTNVGDTGLEDRLQAYVVGKQMCDGADWQTTCKKKIGVYTMQSELLQDIVPNVTVFRSSKRASWWR